MKLVVNYITKQWGRRCRKFDVNCSGDYIFQAKKLNVDMKINKISHSNWKKDDIET